MAYRVEWERGAEKALKKIEPGKQRDRILEAVEEFAGSGDGDVARLKGQEGYRLRVGGYRVLFDIDLVAGTMNVSAVSKRGQAKLY